MEKKRFSKALMAYPAAGLMAGLMLAACGSSQPGPKGAAAKAEISGFRPNTQGGTVWFTKSEEGGTRIQGEVVGLLPNRTYAMHIHERGSCSSPEATGGHFDPLAANRHGPPSGSPGQKHAGDLPNIRTDENGKAGIDVSSHLLGTGTSDFSIIGRSIVIHAGKDDYQSQPAGGSGEKIACGVIKWTEG